MIRTPIEWMTVLHKLPELKRSIAILADLETLYPGSNPVHQDSKARCLANAIHARACDYNLLFPKFSTLTLRSSVGLAKSATSMRWIEFG